MLSSWKLSRVKKLGSDKHGLITEIINLVAIYYSLLSDLLSKFKYYTISIRIINTVHSSVLVTLYMHSAFCTSLSLGQPFFLRLDKKQNMKHCIMKTITNTCALESQTIFKGELNCRFVRSHLLEHNNTV